ncbi:MAG: hypothetical protein GY928_22835 [Colwellia sp.]|nr:hypothetical protein [Colwellia sp.]
MSLLASLSSSSFFLTDYLSELIQSGHVSESQFTYAIKKHNVTALIVQEAKETKGSDNWLDLNRKLATTQSIAALKLARWYQNSSNLETALSDKQASIMWFEQAIRLHSQDAVIDLAGLYFEQGKVIIAKEILGSLVSELGSKALGEARLTLGITIAIHLGNVKLVEQLISSDTFNRYKTEKVQALIADLYKYSVVAPRKAKKSTKVKPFRRKKNNQQSVGSPECISSLQLFATNLFHLKHLDYMIKEFKAKQPLAKYICLPTPKYISTKSIDCSTEKQQAIYCNESLWLSIVETVNTRHIGLMLENGGANVHLGMLYFDVNDDVNVFSHEISHLLGFVDEYPLVKTHNKCLGTQQSQFSHNIVVLNNFYQGKQKEIRQEILKSVPWASQIKSGTPILQSAIKSDRGSSFNAQDYWQLGTPKAFRGQVGLHIAESCDNAILTNGMASSYSAYKPVSERTQLRYNNSEFPKVYLSMLDERSQDFLMPSFHYNIALALFQQGFVKEAKLLLFQAQLWEHTSKRKASILKGEL